MSQVRQEQPSMLARAEAIQRQIHELTSRDTQLWSIVTLIVLVLTAGFLTVVMPNLTMKQRLIRIRGRLFTAIILWTHLPSGAVQHLPAVPAR